jgi:predicted CoA-binding protein
MTFGGTGMVTRSSIDGFLGQKTLAVVGASRDRRKFGNKAYRDLLAKGYQVYPVNPHTETVEQAKCFSRLSALPERVGGVVVVVPPGETEKVVREAQAAGIGRVWLQPGAESAAAVKYCEDNGLDVIHDICILMEAKPTAFYHRVHRFFARLRGKVPK